MKDQTFFLVLPKSIVRAKGWKKGDNIKVNIDDRGKLILDKEK